MIWTELCWGLWRELLKAATTPKDGVGVVHELGSGYSVEKEREERSARLKAACEAVVSDPSLSETQYPGL